MRVRRTGAGRGRKPLWYVWADLEEEQEAIRAGLLDERAPDARWRFVLAWGFSSRSEAREEMKRLEEKVRWAVSGVSRIGRPRSGPGTA